jgi:pectate lyase
VNERMAYLAGVCLLATACDSGYSNWQANGGTGGAAAPAAGSGGSGGSTVEPTANAGAGSGGTAGAPTQMPTVAVCPDDGQDTADLTLDELAVAPVDVDAGAADGGPADAGDTGDAGARRPALTGLIGWASHPGLGLDTTIGGALGRVVTATTAAELEAYAGSAEPLVIRICGTIRAPSVQVSSNKTLVGVGENPTLEGGLAIRGTADAFVKDVIVKNLRVDASFSNVEGVGIMVDKAHHVWVDHNDLFDAVGGLLHVVNGADFVSVSWTKFHFTPDTPDLEHRFGCMIGDSDDKAATDSGHLRVTLHHNWWADYIRQRAPRVRFGDVHLFDNFSSGAGNDYSIWAAVGSRVLLENHYFQGVTNPHELHDPDAQLLAIGSVYDDAVGLMQSTGAAFTPPYVYAMDPTIDVPALVTRSAGPH